MDEKLASILVVDDDERIRDLLVETLKKRGIPVKCARDGEEAVRMFEAEVFAVIITDVMLPKMDGIKAVEKIRSFAKGKTVPIIMMSAVYRDLRMQGDLKSKWNVQFLVKPFSLRVLLQMLEEILNPKVMPEASGKEPTKESPPPQPFLQGNLEHFSIPVLLVSFFSQAKTGILTFKQASKLLKIYLEQGVPVYAQGRMPIKTKEEVEQLLRSCFAWKQGDYLFEPADTLPQDIPKFHYEFYEIVFEGAKRYYQLTFLIGQFEKFQRHRVVRQSGFHEKIAFLTFNEREKLTVENIDDIRTVEDLVTYAPSEIESIFQTLWILHFMDAISFEI